MSEVTQSPAQSPTARENPVNPNAIDFPEAIKAITDGKVVTKLEWDNPDIQVKVVNEKVMIKLEGTWHPLTVSLGDLNGNDWLVL